MLDLDKLTHARRNFLIEPLLAAQQRAGDSTKLAITDRVRHIGHDRHRLVLGCSYLLDETLLACPRRLKLGKSVVEPIVLAQDLRDRHFILGKQRQIREVHLPGQRMLALLRQAHLFVRLVQQLALPGRAYDGQKTYDCRRDEKQGDDQESRQ